MPQTKIDRIEKQIELKAPVSKVWRALADYKEFGQWFGVEMNTPFIAGQPAVGMKTAPGECQGLKFEIVVQKIEPEKLFSYHWHPYAINPIVDYSEEPTTLVEFKLEKTATGTLLTVTESGFDKIPVARRDEAFRKHTQGWEQQIKNVEAYVSKTA
jgi:uncharacterized protein YndB with AHSA1/START domain